MKKVMALLCAVLVASLSWSAEISYTESGEVTIPALTEDTTINVAADVTVRNIAGLSGVGKLVKAGAGTLVLSVAAANGFESEIEISEGVIDVLVQGALGEGKVSIVGTTTDKRQLHFGNNTAAMTVANEVYVNSAATSAAIFFDWGGIPNVKNQPKLVTFTGGIKADSDLYLDDQLQKTQGGNNYVTFDCPVDATGHMIRFSVGNTPYWKGVVKASQFVSAGEYGSDTRRKTGAHYFYAKNEIGELKFTYNSIYGQCERCFDGSVFNWNPFTSDNSLSRGCLNLCAGEHRAVYLTGVSRGSKKDVATILSGADLGTTLTVTGATDVASATAYCALNGGLTLVLDAPGFTQTLADRTHATTGGIVVRHGTLRTSGIAAFSKLTSLRVEGGSLEYVSTVDTAFAALTNLTVKSEASASFTSSQTALFPVDSTMDLYLETGASLSLPAGMTDIYAQYFYVNNRARKVGSYTHELVTEIPEGVTVHVAKAPSEELTPIGWTGGAGDDTSVARAANWGETGEDLDFGGNKYQATFAAADTQGHVATIDGSVYLNQLSFANGDFLVEGTDPDAMLSLYDGNVKIAEPAEGDPLRSYVLNVPTRYLSDSVVTVPSNVVFSISNGLASAYNVEVNGSGAFNLKGGATIGGQLKIGLRGAVRLSGLITSPNGADLTSDPATAADALVLNPAASSGGNGENGQPIVFDNVVIEKPLRLLPRYAYSYYPADIQAAVGSTNVVLSKESNSSPGTRFEALEGSLLVFSNSVNIGWAFATRGAGAIHFAKGVTITKTYEFRNGNVIVDKFLTAPLLQFQGDGKAMLTCGDEMASLPPVTIPTAPKYEQGIDIGCNVVSIPYVLGGNKKLGFLSGREGGLLRFTTGALDDDDCKSKTNVSVRVDGALGIEACVPAGSCVFLAGGSYSSTGPLVASSGVLELAADAVWTNGTRIAAVGESAQTYGTLRINSAKSFSKSVAAEISGFGRFEVPAGVKLRVASLMIDGQAVPPGVYDKSAPEIKGHLLGDGLLAVGKQGLVLMVR